MIFAAECVVLFQKYVIKIVVTGYIAFSSVPPVPSMMMEVTSERKYEKNSIWTDVQTYCEDKNPHNNIFVWIKWGSRTLDWVTFCLEIEFWVVKKEHSEFDCQL